MKISRTYKLMWPIHKKMKGSVVSLSNITKIVFIMRFVMALLSKPPCKSSFYVCTHHIIFLIQYQYLHYLSQSPDAVTCHGVSLYHFVAKTFIFPLTSILQTSAFWEGSVKVECRWGITFFFSWYTKKPSFNCPAKLSVKMFFTILFNSNL